MLLHHHELLGHIENLRADDEVTYRDDWATDPLLVSANQTVREAARPGTDLYKQDLHEYVEDRYEATGGDGYPTAQAWFDACLNDAAAWNHFGDGTVAGMRWSMWAHIDFGHGALCHVTDEATGVVTVLVDSVL